MPAAALRNLAIRYFMADRFTAQAGVDRTTFRAAVALFRRWCPGADESLARETVGAIVLDLIHDDPAWFWRDAGPGSPAAA